MISFTPYSKHRLFKREDNTFDELWCFSNIPSHDAHPFDKERLQEQFLLIPGHLLRRFLLEYPIKMAIRPRNEAQDRYESENGASNTAYAYIQKLTPGLARECIPFAFHPINTPDHLETRRYYFAAHCKARKVDSICYEPISHKEFYELANQFL